MLSASEYESLRDSPDNPETSPQPRSLHENSTSESVPSWNISSSDVEQNRKSAYHMMNVEKMTFNSSCSHFI